MVLLNDQVCDLLPLLPGRVHPCRVVRAACPSSNPTINQGDENAGLHTSTLYTKQAMCSLEESTPAGFWGSSNPRINQGNQMLGYIQLYIQ